MEKVEIKIRREMKSSMLKEKVLEEEGEITEEEATMDGEIQEECGVVPQLDGDFVSLVLSEGFPSWSFVLQSLGCKKIHTVTDGLTLEEKNELRTARPGESTSWRNLSQVCEKLKSQPRVFVWVQGSEAFINKAILT